MVSGEMVGWNEPRPDLTTHHLTVFCYAVGVMTERAKLAIAGSQTTPSRADLVALYRRAFAQYRARALWNIREYDDPTPQQILAITRQLRTEGDMNARRLAEEIEEAARAHL
jgi:hypothetical protein